MTDVENAQYHSIALLDHLARAGRRAAETMLDPTGLRPRHLIALTLLSDHGAASQQGLADTLSLDPSNVVGLLNELEERGLITRRRDVADRRRHIVEISTEGENQLRAAQRLLACVEDDVLRALSPDERAALHTLLVRAAGGQLPDTSACAVIDENEACSGQASRPVDRKPDGTSAFNTTIVASTMVVGSELHGRGRR